MGHVIPFMILLVTMLLQERCQGASIRKQVRNEVRKSTKDLEDRLMKSITDSCHKQSCASGTNPYVFLYFILPVNI